MAHFDLVMPKLGESIIEATITRWLKKEGDPVAEDESIVEIATDKVDSEIPSPVDGVILKINFREGDVVPVGQVIAVIDLGGTAGKTAGPAKEPVKETKKQVEAKVPVTEKAPVVAETETYTGSRFYSPLVRNIAREENITPKELDTIKGTGQNDRVTKQDVLQYLENRRTGKPAISAAPPATATPVSAGSQDKIIEMDRVRQLIAKHMVNSMQTSPHVTSFVEVDMTKVVLWRNKFKDDLLEREGEKLTFTPIFIDAIARAVHDYPMVNVSVDGKNIIVHRDINVGMAVALPSNNLIVPVVKSADQKSLLGLVKNVNDLANRARINKLLPDEVFGGTISLTNFGSFGTLMGIPIINQPQTAIVGVGSIVKRPVVVETPNGDAIVIRHIMMLSVTYDHRVIDGALGGVFLSRMAKYLENFDTTQTI